MLSYNRTSVNILTTKDVQLVDSYFHVPNPLVENSETKDAIEVSVSESENVKGLFSPSASQIITYLFPADQYTASEAIEWVNDKATDYTVQHVKATLKRGVKVKSKKTGKTITKMLAIASNETVDRDGEVISIDGWDIKNYKDNPVILWLHNRSAERTLPIGKAKSIGFRTVNGKKSLVFEPEFETKTEFGRTIVDFVADGLLNTFSVGFMPLERDPKDFSRFTKQELLEISLVPVPSLAGAQFIERAKSLGVSEKVASDFVEVIKSKAVVPFKATRPADRGLAWDGNAAMSRARTFCGGPDKEEIEFERYKMFFAWVDGADETSFGSYKLPHHDVIGGSMVVVFRGVVAAMAALLGARGGVAIPEGERRGVYEHLAKHYAQFEEEPPEFKLVESQELKELFTELESNIKQERYAHIENAIKDIRQHIRNKRKVAAEQPDSQAGNEPDGVAFLKQLNESITKRITKLKVQ